MLIKLDTEAKFHGLQLLQKIFLLFVFAKLINIDFSVGKKKYLTCNLLKRDRAALVGLPSAARGAKDIPHRRIARPKPKSVIN